MQDPALTRAASGAAVRIEVLFTGTSRLPPDDMVKNMEAIARISRLDHHDPISLQARRRLRFQVTDITNIPGSPAELIECPLVVVYVYPTCSTPMAYVQGCRYTLVSNGRNGDGSVEPIADVLEVVLVWLKMLEPGDPRLEVERRKIKEIMELEAQSHDFSRFLDSHWFTQWPAWIPGTGVIEMRKIIAWFQYR